MPINIEIKARCNSPDNVRAKLTELNADYIGCDHQIDTYFAVSEGRLKLREGKIENNLIYYRRADQAGPKQSDFFLHPVDGAESLKHLLTMAFDVRAVVEKRRHIYYIDNVKFHVDEVSGLGSFVEIEAGNLTAPLSEAELREQCNQYLLKLGIVDSDLVDCSYSDLLLEQISG